MTTFRIYIRTDQKNTDGTSSVLLSVTIKRKKKKFTITKVNSKDWNANKSLVKRSDVFFIRKNKLITKFKNKAQFIIDDYFLKDKILTLNLFIKEFDNNSKNINCFFHFVENELKNKVLASETLRTYKASISKLKQFRKNVNIDDINLTFIEAYKKYMIEVLENKPNTWNRSLGHLRNFLNWAIKKEIIEKNPFDKISIKSVASNRKYLTTDELLILHKIKNSPLLNQNDVITLNYFLFSCYTGLRFTDVENLKQKNIKNDFVEIETHKTNKFVSIPLIKASRELVAKSEYPNQKVFKVACNQVTNKRLKKIMKIANIDKKISFHCSRHTFATIGYSLGIPLLTIKELLGHKDITTTQIYTKVSKEQKVKEMRKFE